MEEMGYETPMQKDVVAQDSELEASLKMRFQDSEKQAATHKIELERHQRIMSATRAALDVLSQKTETPNGDYNMPQQSTSYP